MSILKLKDSQGNWISVPTLKGDKGNGIQSAVLNNDYTLTLTFTDGTTYTTPSIRGEKGEQGEPATDMDIHICSASEYDSETRIPTITSPDDKTFYLVPTENGTSPDLFTEWVYVDGVWEMFGSASVDLTDYIKNTDYATNAKAGIIKLNPYYGINVTEDGILYVNTAESKNAKMGTNNARPITPIIQHESTFYGLAKASGHDEKDSELPVGQYTDEAKSSIQNMLDVPSNSELKEVNDSKADVIVESASGDIVSFDDGADNMPLKSLVVDINPVQDLNGYDSPWVGGGGKNLLDPSILKDQVAWNVISMQLKPSTAYTMSSNCPSTNGLVTYFTTDGLQPSNRKVSNGYPVTQTSDENGIIKVIQRRASGEDSFANYHFQVEEGSTATDWTPYENVCPINGWTGMQLAQTGKNLWNGTLINGDVDIDVKVGITYTISAIASSNTYLYLRRRPIGTSDYTRVRYVLAGATNGSATFVPEEGYIYSLWSNATYTAIEDVQIEVDSTPTSYEPYNGTTISINWQTEAGTVYGGKLDVLTGILTITMALMNLGAHSNWTYDNTSFAYGFFTANGITTKANGSSNIVCTQYKTIHGGRSALTSNATICPYNTSNSNSVCIRDDAYTDVAEFKSAMDGVQMAYELKTPIEIQLTPTEVRSLLGTNNIWADTGATSIEYCADTEMYIEKVKPIVNVDDVQINGTSIVNDGVANVPLASPDNYGVVKIGNGVTIVNVGTNKLLSVNRATDAQVKDGTQIYRPITPVVQDSSTFYGLAKAAGADEKDSTLAFGTYSDNAKSSIQNMLGITDKYSPKEWVAESETELVTNAHNIGDLFYIGETLYKVIADLNAGDAINVGVNVEEVNANDILDDYATKEDVQDNVSIVEKSASGSIASFDDGMDDMPLKSLTVDINPVQDLHGYDNPWIGGGGKNKFDIKNAVLAVGYDAAFRSNGYAQVNVYTTDTGIASDEKNINCGRAVCLGLLPAGTYILSYVNNSGVTLSFTVSYTITNVVPQDGPLERTSVVTTNNQIIQFEADGVSYYWLGMYSAAAESYRVDDIMVRLATESDATYEPYENICPISGWTGMNIQRDGKNLFYPPQTEERTYRGITVSVSGDTYTVTGTASGGAETRNLLDNSRANFYTSIRLRDNIWVEAGTYTFTAFRSKANGSVGMVYGTDLDETYTSANNHYIALNSPATLTFSEKTYITPYVSFSNGVASDYTLTIQIESGTASTEYEPYQGQSIPINWETEAGTVYGGKLDVLSGELVIDRAMVDLGTLGYSKSSLIHNGFVATSGMPNDFPLAPSTTAVPNWICSNYGNIVSNVVIESASVDYALAWRVSAQNKGIIVKDSNYTELYTNNDMASFKAAMSGVQLVYELAEPITIQLTPIEVRSLLGQNNIWADTGNTSVEYFSQVDKDLMDYIETSLKPYAKEERLNDYVNDVQLNGISIVTNGVANVSVPLRVKDDPSENGGVIEGDVNGDNCNTASGQYAHAEGFHTKATGNFSHAEGFKTEAYNNGSHAEGSQTKALANCAHAEGVLTLASGVNSHAEGMGTIANRRSLHVHGEYNAYDSGGTAASDRGIYVEIVGNGTDANTRSNARTLDWNGNEALAGSLTLGMNTQDEISISANELKKIKETSHVSDVQINGTSIVTNNVANVPVATRSVIGALYTASEADGKVGTHTYRAIVPQMQHSSVFYGLAKAAGDTTQSASDNAIGTYTEEAKTAIKQMLGVHDTIDSFVEEVTGTDVTITGQPSYRYNCGELYSLTVTPPSNGTIDIRFTSGSTPTVLTLPQTVKMPEWWVEVEANTIYEMCITDGMYCGVMTWAI